MGYGKIKNNLCNVPSTVPGYRSIFHKDVLDILMKYEKAINSSSWRQGNEKIIRTYNSAVQNQASVFCINFYHLQVYKYID